MLAGDCRKAANRLGYGYRRRRAASLDDAALLLSLVGDRMGWRTEALAAMQLLSTLAARPQEEPDTIAAIMSDMAKIQADLIALKGVVSDHEIAIIDM